MPQEASVRETARVGFRVEEDLTVVLAWKPSPGPKAENTSPHHSHPRCPVFSLQFKNPLILLLLASALVSVLTKEYEDAVSIAVVSAGWGALRRLPDPTAQGLTESLPILLGKKKRVWL